MTVYKVYAIYVNDKETPSYIGSTNDENFRKRNYAHRRDGRFGVDFNMITVYETLDYEHCLEIEAKLISEFDTYNNGLNKTRDGRGNHNSSKFTTKGYKFSEESKKRMSEIRLKKIRNGEIAITRPPCSIEEKEGKRKLYTGKIISFEIPEERIEEIKAYYFSDPVIEHYRYKDDGKKTFYFSYNFSFYRWVSDNFGISIEQTKSLIQKKTYKDTNNIHKNAKLNKNSVEYIRDCYEKRIQTGYPVIPKTHYFRSKHRALCKQTADRFNITPTYVDYLVKGKCRTGELYVKDQ